MAEHPIANRPAGFPCPRLFPMVWYVHDVINGGTSRHLPRGVAYPMRPLVSRPRRCGYENDDAARMDGQTLASNYVWR